MTGIPVDTNLRSIAVQRSIRRRRFLWDVARTTAATSVFGHRTFGQASRGASPAKKLVVVTFETARETKRHLHKSGKSISHGCWENSYLKQCFSLRW